MIAKEKKMMQKQPLNFPKIHPTYTIFFATGVPMWIINGSLSSNILASIENKNFTSFASILHYNCSLTYSLLEAQIVSFM